MNSEKFATLAPTFRPEYESVVDRILHDCFRNYADMTTDFQRLIRMTVASVIYHKDELIEKYFTNLDDNKARHPILNNKNKYIC